MLFEDGESTTVRDNIMDTRGTGIGMNTRAVNYCSIHGTTPGGGVDAKSSIAVEVTQQLINKSMNLRSECIVPEFLNDFRGGDNKSVCTLNTATYSIGFGIKSEFDSATEDLYKEFGVKFSNAKEA